MSLVELAQKIRTRALSAVAVVSAFLDRIENIDSGIGAWSAIAGQHAIDTAFACDRELANGQLRGSLHGVPVGIKDIIDTAGIRTRYGSPLYADHVPLKSAAAVLRLEAAGAIVLGKLATAEFASLDPAGTRNPRNRAHTPGGSSSGSAAAVAARMCPAALGTQTAGSIGRPAAYCGVVGCMPSESRIPRDGVFPAAWSLDHVGAFARSVDDVRAVIQAMAETTFPTGSGDASRVRAGVVGEYFRRHADPDAWDAHAAFVDRLRGTGDIRVSDVGLPAGFDQSVQALWTIMTAEIATVHRERFEHQRDAIGPQLAALIEQGLRLSAREYVEALETRRRFQSAMAALFDGVDVIVSPGAVGTAPKGLERTGDPVINAPWTLADAPTITIPITPETPDPSEDGPLPLGVQISARSLDESTLFRAARRIEAVARS